MIAGLFQTWRNAPTVNMDRAKRRRAYVLQRMAEEGYITQKEADAATARPIVVAPPANAANSIAPYFVEEVRKELESRYGAKPLYENGLTIQTALDVKLQESANRALDDGLRRIDKRRGFRKPRRNILAEGQKIDSFKNPRWDRSMAVTDVIPAIVTSADGLVIQLRAGSLRVTVDRKGFAWTGKATGTQLVTTGDLVETRLLTIDEAAHTATGTLEQTPLMEGAVLAIDNRTARSARSLAVTASIGASSIGPPRRTDRSDRHSNRSSTRRPSTVATRHRRSSWIRRRAFQAAQGHRCTRR